MFARLHRPLAAAVLSVALAAGVGACGSSGDEPLKGETVTGPGVTATQPPWPAEKQQLARRIRLLGLPSPGKEKFHEHMQLRIYDDGILIPVAAGIGLDLPKKIASGVHTHEGNGIIHLEADKPFKVTLGDFFAIWGVEFGPGQIGALKAKGDDKLRVFVNGKQIADPARHMLKKNDNIVIAYGSSDNFPRVPDTTALRAANGLGPRPASCSSGKKDGKKPKSCLIGDGVPDDDEQASQISP